MIKVVQLDKRASCLPGYENFETKQIACRMGRPRLKSTEQLRQELIAKINQKKGLKFAG